MYSFIHSVQKGATDAFFLLLNFHIDRGIKFQHRSNIVGTTATTFVVVTTAAVVATAAGRVLFGYSKRKRVVVGVHFHFYAISCSTSTMCNRYHFFFYHLYYYYYSFSSFYFYYYDFYCHYHHHHLLFVPNDLLFLLEKDNHYKGAVILGIIPILLVLVVFILPTIFLRANVAAVVSVGVKIQAAKRSSCSCCCRCCRC